MENGASMSFDFEKHCEARFSTISNVTMPEEGGPCRISILQMASRLPKPEPEPAKGYVWLRNQPMWFVGKPSPHTPTGRDWMLTWRIGPFCSPSGRSDLPSPVASVPIGSVSTSGRWFKDKWRFLDIHLKGSHMETLVDVVGTPTILERFGPSRRPAVLRVKGSFMEPWVLL